MTTKPNDVADELERRLANAQDQYGHPDWSLVEYGEVVQRIAADAIAALRARPADKGREVVAWMTTFTLTGVVHGFWRDRTTAEHFVANNANFSPDAQVRAQPLYAHPPERQDEENARLFLLGLGYHYDRSAGTWVLTDPERQDDAVLRLAKELTDRVCGSRAVRLYDDDLYDFADEVSVKLDAALASQSSSTGRENVK